MSIKIGIIADVHSNVEAFRTTVDYLTELGCREFMLLGDFVSDTPRTRETMDYLYELIDTYPCHVLRGNREEYILEGRRKGSSIWLKNSASGNILYTYERLEDKDLDFFENLPISFVYEKDGFPRVTFCHGAPDNTRTLLSADGEKTYHTMESLDTKYLVAAHTHLQCKVEYAGKTYVNTGSCGISIGDPGMAHAAIMIGEKGDWTIETLRIPYDSKKVVEDMFNLGLYDYAPWFISNNLHTIIKGIDVTPELVQLAMKYQTNETKEETIWPYIEERFFEMAAKDLSIPDYGYLRDMCAVNTIFSLCEASRVNEN